MINDFIPELEYKNHRFYINEDTILGKTITAIDKGFDVSCIGSKKFKFNYEFIRCNQEDLEGLEDEDEYYSNMILRYNYNIKRVSKFIDLINKIILSEDILNELVWCNASDYGFYFDNLNCKIGRKKMDLAKFYTKYNFKTSLDSKVLVVKNNKIIEEFSDIREVMNSKYDGKYKVWINISYGIYKEYKLSTLRKIKSLRLIEKTYLGDSTEELLEMSREELYDYLYSDKDITTKNIVDIVKGIQLVRFREWVKNNFIYFYDEDMILIETYCAITTKKGVKKILYQNENFKELKQGKKFLRIRF